MHSYFKLAAYLFLGGFIGLVTAWAAIGNQYGLFRKQALSWVVWPNAGSPKADPYTIAHFTRAGILPAKNLEVIYYYAETDTDGQPLLGSCNYMISGGSLQASEWSLTLYDGDGDLIRNPARRYGFNSRNTAFAANGNYVIWVSKDATPGNWLPNGRSGKRQFVLRLYNPDRGYVSDALSAPLPEIRKTGCHS